MVETTSTFPIPSSLQDLERSPYNLLPYPQDFLDDDEAARGESFLALVHQLEQENRALLSVGTMALFHEKEDPWMDDQRIQALYTLVRKSPSLAPATKTRLADALSQAMRGLSSVLETASKADSNETAPQAFRDSFACHLYMLYTFMFFLEVESKGNKASEEVVTIRKVCANSMLVATQAMARYRTTLWKRGVPEESVVVLPCRIAYTMLESATGVIARKAACADEAVKMIAVSVDSTETLLSTVTAALVDMMHSFEHMAPIVAELCTTVSEDPVNRLAVELMREMGRLEGTDAKANGIKNVAPFISELACYRPRLVLANLSHILPHLRSEPHNLRSAIVTAIAHILLFLGKESDEGNANAPLDVRKSQSALLDLLTERVYDVSSFTRSAVMKAWIQLTSNRALPKERIIKVSKIAMDRLQDKTVLVRRQAMQLLTSLLENNPFMGSLDPKPYHRKLAELYDSVKATMPPHIKEAYDESLKTAEDEEARRELERATLAAAIEEAQTLTTENLINELPEAEREFCNKIQALSYVQAALEFIEIFEDANGSLEGMLLSANTSDVTEALRFFVQARHFQLPCAVTGMKHALSLMWASEQSVRDEVLKAFVEVFIAVPGTDGSKLLPDDQIAKNLLQLVGTASVSELASIEEAIHRLVKEHKVPGNVFKVLWTVVSKGSIEARAAALHILSMGASADRAIIDSKSRLKLLLDSALGECNKDWRLIRAAAVAVQRVGRTKVDPSDAKYLVLECIAEELCAVARGDYCEDIEDDTKRWFSASEQAIKALFVVSPAPEVACRDIIVGMSKATFYEDQVHSLRLARFFHTLGHIALHLLVHTEGISGLVRRGNAKKTLKKQEAAGKRKNEENAAEDSLDDAIETELGIAAEAEAENERKLVDISEKEIVGRGLISAFGPRLARVVANEGGEFNSEILMQSSTLALCKFMCVSSSFCETHLPLLFKALADAPSEDTTMRANTAIALGDLAFRFPNEVEPYTPKLYACLRDSSTKVRRHTLMVLTHLILNDMVKVKGQVCEIAMCLRDQDPRIRDMSRLLFHELSKRSNNPVYNLLPDIISQLSQLSIRKEDFRAIMSFLLGYIKKDRQNEGLTEKLCQRFPKCDSISQKGDLAYCLAQLKMSERCIKCLSDNFKLYKDALHDEDVKKHILSIVLKFKKQAKPESRQFLDEWEAKLNETAQLSAENELANKKAACARMRSSYKDAKKKRCVSREQGEMGDESEISGEEDTAEKENIPRSARRARISQKVNLT